MLLNLMQSPGPPEIPRRASTQAAGEENFAQDTSTESQRIKNEDEGKIENMPVSQNNVPIAGDSSLGFDPNASFSNMTNMSMGQFNPMLQLLQGGMPSNMMGQFPNMMGKSYQNFLIHQSRMLIALLQACLAWEWIRWLCPQGCLGILADRGWV